MILEFLRNIGAILVGVLSLLWRGFRWVVTKMFRGMRRGFPAVFRMLRSYIRWLIANRREPSGKLAIIGTLLVVAGVVIYLSYRTVRFVEVNVTSDRIDVWTLWWTGTQQERETLVTQQFPCPGAPFILPSEGYIGLLYADPRLPYSESRRHQGIDIFSIGEPGVTPVYAAYDGYITRQTYWASAVIQRVPDDPLSPGRQIWLYYTHMAPADGSTDYIVDVFEPGVSEIFVEQGTLIGYTGDYAGPGGSIATHLHFSIVLSDAMGGYLSELEFTNTLDPSRYLGIPVNYNCAPDIPRCSETPLCAEALLGGGG